MKWETYCKLSIEHREEWNFRFKDINLPSIDVGYIFGLWMVVTSYMAICLVIIKGYIDLPTFSFLKLMGRLMGFTSAVIVAYLVDILGQFWYYSFKCLQAHKWLKERGYK